MPSLFVIRGNDQGTRFELDGSLMGIGRDSSNKVQLHDTEVSRQHAEIRRADGTFHVIDLNRAMRIQQGLLPKHLPFSDRISGATLVSRL